MAVTDNADARGFDKVAARAAADRRCSRVEFMAETAYDNGWAVAEHAPAADEYWGQDALVSEPTSEQKKGATAPSVLAGKQRFEGILARNSAEAVCNVAFRTPRAAVKINDVVVPAGFPSVVGFWRAAKSVRMFSWGVRKWQEVYPGAAWAAPTLGSGFSACAAGRLRRTIVIDSKEKPVTNVQAAIVKEMVLHGVVRRADRAASAFLRITINTARWRKSVTRCLFFVRLRRMLAAKRRKRTRRPTGRESPSLKLART